MKYIGIRIFVMQNHVIYFVPYELYFSYKGVSGGFFLFPFVVSSMRVRGTPLGQNRKIIVKSMSKGSFMNNINIQNRIEAEPISIKKVLWNLTRKIFVLTWRLHYDQPKAIVR